MDFRATFDDLDRSFFAVLGEDGTLNGQPVRGMYRQGESDPDLGGLPTGLHEPTWLMRDAEALAAGAEVGGELQVRGDRYRVVRLRRDGLGLVDLVLRAV